MYEVDSCGDFAPFIVAKIKGDGVFLEAFKALIAAGFELGRPNDNGQTFIKALC